MKQRGKRKKSDNPDISDALSAALQASRTEHLKLQKALDRVETLTPEQRLLLVNQAIMLLESFFVHLPLKRAMHAVEPLQRLRLLRRRLARFENDSQFHAEMRDIFISVRDLHTNYRLPDDFKDAYARLPFRVEAYFENGVRKYLVAGVADGFSHETFGPGVEVHHWNGVPIERAVEIVSARHAGSNPEARRARGVVGLTTRWLQGVPPPDEEWVIVGYRTPDGRDYEFRAVWAVEGIPTSVGGGAFTSGVSVGATTVLGVDDEIDAIRRLYTRLFAPNVVADAARLGAAADPVALVQGTESTMPSVFDARPVPTPHGEFGLIRIRKFVDDPNENAEIFTRRFLNEFIRLADILPKSGLIIDVRGNGGGVILAGERLLQLLTPKQIEPTRYQFINTDLTLRLCRIQNGLAAWAPSIDRSGETGAIFSAAFPITSPELCNAIGQRYFGPVILITDALCYSTTDIFAAGFQDHEIGDILGVDANTGAGGANVWTHALLDELFRDPETRKPLPESPFEPLPNGMIMRVAIRRTLRVGKEAGTELEDLGVHPKDFHQMTRKDLLEKNEDLYEHAASILATKLAELPSGQPNRLDVEVSRNPDGSLVIEATTRNVNRLDVFLDGRPQRSTNVVDGTTLMDVPLSSHAAAVLDIKGYRDDDLVAARRQRL